MTQIHIPTGINFECTGCGNCCLQWPVPVTADDFQRISSIDDLEFQTAGLQFRPLSGASAKMKVFTHTLEKRQDGKCEFLTTQNRCRLHEKFSADMKPSMCQLFPYTFTSTPSGVYASLSFASSGVLFNSGRALSEQADLLQEKWQLFGRLFPDLQADWSQTQLVDGVALSWDEYLSLDVEFLKLLNAGGAQRIEQKLWLCSRYLRQKLPSSINLEKDPTVEAGSKLIDLLLLKYLRALYLPDDVFGNSQTDLDTAGLMQDLINPPNMMQFECRGQAFTVKQIRDLQLGKLPDEAEDLLNRFIYCRVFAKLYFGFGFANLSVLIGLHHLILLMVLLRVEIKLLRMTSNGSGVEFMEIAELVRTLERRLTQVNLSAVSTAALEALLRNPSRLERLISLAA